MSTRGTVGIRKDEVDKLMYNHFDSYPSGLGETMVQFIQKYTDSYIAQLFDNLKPLEEKDRNKKLLDCDKETREKVRRIKNSYMVGEPFDDITLEQIAGILEGSLELYALYPEITFFLEDSEFIKDSLFCEWGYIINLDTQKLEVYKGNQIRPQRYNRFGTTKTGDELYPCRAIKKIPLSRIRKKGFSLKEELKEYY